MSSHEWVCLPTTQPTDRQAWKSLKVWLHIQYKTANLVFGLCVSPAQLCHLWQVPKTPSIYFFNTVNQCHRWRQTAVVSEMSGWPFVITRMQNMFVPPPNYTSSNDMLKPRVCFSAFIVNLTKASCDNITTHSWLWYIHYMILDLKMLYNSYISNKKNNNMFFFLLVGQQIYSMKSLAQSWALRHWFYSLGLSHLLFNNLQHSRF